MSGQTVAQRKWLKDVRDAILISIGVAITVTALIYFTGGHHAIIGLLAYPDGGVWSNFAETAYLLAGPLFVTVRRNRANHRELKLLMHRQHQERLAQAQEHHEMVLAHVSSQVRQAATGEVDGMCQGVTKKHRACRNPAVFGTSRCRVHRIGVR